MERMDDMWVLGFGLVHAPFMIMLLMELYDIKRRRFMMDFYDRDSENPKDYDPEMEAMDDYESGYEDGYEDGYHTGYLDGILEADEDFD